jgi:hypothetical protein
MPQFDRSSLRASFVCGCFFVALANAGVAPGQSEAETRLVRTSIGPGGLGRYQRDQWSVVSINASNRSDSDTETSVSVFLEGDSRIQYTRDMWLPAHASRKTWLPIRPPADIPYGQAALTATPLQVIDSEGDAILSRAEGEQLMSDTFLLLDSSEFHTGTIFGRALPGQPDVTSRLDDEAYETVVAVRMLHDGERKTSNFSDHFLPPYPEAYDALDQLVLCNERLAADSGGMAAIRSWIARGGRAWIMLDLVGMDTVHKLLGNATPCEIVDRVELTEFTIETPALVAVGTDSFDSWLAEEPVEFVRVTIDSAEVHSSIDGWPAAFSIPFGEGQVLITTLAARGWRYQLDEFADPTEPQHPTSGPTNALRHLAGEFNQSTLRHAAFNDELRPLLSEQLGYRIPSRSIAALILGLNCAVIVIAGVWFSRREQLQRIAWVVPGATTLSALVLVMIGSANTSSIPATSSILRLANVSSETNEIHTETLAAFYSPETVALPLQVDLAGVVAPDMQDLVGVAKRAIWDDDGNARWEQIDVASGSVRFAQARESRVLEHPLGAQAVFGPQGLEGRIIGVGQVGTPTDAIIAAPPAPHSNSTITKTGAFEVGAKDLLSETEFLGGAMLSDEQQRRQTIYRQLLAPREGNIYPQRPTLFVWGDSHSFGLTTPELFRESGATLYAIPLNIGRTLPNQPFLVPSTFIRMRNGRAKQGASAMYNPRTGRWMKDATLPTQSFYQFVLPREVVPCKVRTAEITLKIHAPSRTIELIGSKGIQQVVVATRESPSGVLSFTIDDPELLELDPDGGLGFGVTVSPTEEQAAAIPNQPRDPEQLPDSLAPSTWQIDYLRIQVVGETL